MEMQKCTHFICDSCNGVKKISEKHVCKTAYTNVENPQSLHKLMYNAYHALYWDGQQLWDPNPETENGRPVESYEVCFWYPILKKEKIDV